MPRDDQNSVDKEVESLGDVETSPSFPSALLAAFTPATPEARARRRRTDQEIWTLAWPVILSQSLVSAISLADIAMVGRLGRDSVAAVGYATQYLWLTQSVLFAVGVACVALMARAIGAGQIERARQAFGATLYVALAIAAGVSLVVLIAPRPLLRLLDAQPGVVELAVPYFRLTVGSTLLLAIEITIESALRADRNTRTAMWIVAMVTSLKIALNFLLIFGMLGFPRWELFGAGLATVVSQSLGVGLFLVALTRRKASSPVSLDRRNLVASRLPISEVVRLALPAVGERIAMNGAMMAYFAFLGRYGTAAVAAYTIGIRVLSFSWIPGVGFATAAATLVGQSLGGDDARGAARAGWRATRLALGVSLTLGTLYALSREPLARLFTNDLSIIEELGPFMLVLALAQPLMALHFTLGGALRGAGDTWTPMVATTIGNWVFRVPVAWACASLIGTPVLWLWGALVLDHLARALWMAWAFLGGRWQGRSVSRTGGRRSGTGTRARARRPRPRRERGRPS